MNCITKKLKVSRDVCIIENGVHDYSKAYHSGASQSKVLVAEENAPYVNSPNSSIDHSDSDNDDDDYTPNYYYSMLILLVLKGSMNGLKL